VIRREELYSTAIDASLEQMRSLREREIIEPEPVSRLRRLLMSSLFYLPVAGLLGAWVAWALLEPGFHDLSIIGGEVVLVNTDPFDLEIKNAVVLTVGAKEVIVIPGQTRFEPGAEGEPPFENLAAVGAGAVLEAAGEQVGENRMCAYVLRPATRERAEATGQEIQPEVTAAIVLFFPLTALAIALFLLAAEGISTRNWVRMLERLFLGGLLTVVFVFLAMIPAGLLVSLGEFVLETIPGLYNVHSIPAVQFILFTACRSAAWACMGAAVGLGMNLTRSSRTQLRNAVIGGALGGALGGAFFDPVDRFLGGESFFSGAEASRLVGMSAVGLGIGVFVALVDRLAREAWVRVKTGPLAGKSFVLYRTPTLIGSAPTSDIYLFKDPDLDPTHAAIHRVGNQYEIEDMGSRKGMVVSGRRLRRHRLTTGDQIELGGTVLEFEERARPSRTQLSRE